jgi:hypothetical protein
MDMEMDMAMDMAIITITTTRNEWPSKTSAKKRKPQIKAKPPQLEEEK